jgi:hypothetical protein
MASTTRPGPDEHVPIISTLAFQHLSLYARKISNSSTLGGETMFCLRGSMQNMFFGWLLILRIWTWPNTSALSLQPDWIALPPVTRLHHYIFTPFFAQHHVQETPPSHTSKKCMHECSADRDHAMCSFQNRTIPGEELIKKSNTLQNKR